MHRLLLALALMTAPTPPENPTQPFSALVEPQWKKTAQPTPATPEPPPGVFWDWAVTPPFPAAWPMKKDTAVVQWVYAYGRTPNIQDGVRVSAAWAKLVLGKDAPALTRVSPALKELGIQGVRPISAEQAHEQRRAYQAAPELRAGKLDAIRGAYCLWASNNGVIAESIKAEHAAFFAALACK